MASLFLTSLTHPRKNSFGYAAISKVGKVKKLNQHSPHNELLFCMLA
jgi:hypothetical protein